MLIDQIKDLIKGQSFEELTDYIELLMMDSIIKHTIDLSAESFNLVFKKGGFFIAYKAGEKVSVSPQKSLLKFVTSGMNAVARGLLKMASNQTKIIDSIPDSIGHTHPGKEFVMSVTGNALRIVMRSGGSSKEVELSFMLFGDQTPPQEEINEQLSLL